MCRVNVLLRKGEYMYIPRMYLQSEVHSLRHTSCTVRPGGGTCRTARELLSSNIKQIDRATVVLHGTRRQQKQDSIETQNRQLIFHLLQPLSQSSRKEKKKIIIQHNHLHLSSSYPPASSSYSSSSSKSPSSAYTSPSPYPSSSLDPSSSSSST